MQRTSTSDTPSADDGQLSTRQLIDRIADGHRGKLVAVSVLAFVGGFAEAGVLVIIARLAFVLAAGESQVTVDPGPLGSISLSVPAVIAVAAALAIFRVALQVTQSQIMTKLFADVWSGVRTRMMLLYVGASWALQSGERQGRLQELLTTYAMRAADTLASLSSALVALLSLIAFLCTAFFVNALAALAVVVAAVVVAMLLRPLRTLVRRRSRAAAQANLAFATDITEFAANVQEMRVFDVEDTVAGRITVGIEDASRLQQRAHFIAQLTPALYQGMAMLLVIGAVGVVYASGVTRLASLGGIVLIMVRSLSYGQQLQSNYQSLFASAPYFETLRDEEARYAAAAVLRTGGPIDHIGELVFEDVSYEYVADRPVLHHLSFAVRPGEMIGIIGPSGSGKSTLVQLLLRLREPTIGRVLADGEDVAGTALSDWYKRVSFVPQEPRFFAGTVAENIRFYRDDIDDAAVERAAKLANLHEEITALADGYDTSVGERGSALSGGQRQRLSIARSLAEEPDVLVLDEPTSSLDVRSESLIRETLAGLAPRTTIFVIAHRMSTLEACDRIMVVHGGELQGFDAPARLEAANPFYAEALKLSGLRE
ncbi:MAG TPA: ABC transporter ATP-binding protein [Acidimicrobiia bacterium]|jgi:ABC-type multidrug transport system fused ATPase/permease subunit